MGINVRSGKMMDIMSVTYETPPLIEAVCAITYSESGDWDPTVSELFFEWIREGFPTINTRSATVCSGISEAAEAEVSTIDVTSFMNTNKNIEVTIYEKKMIVRALEPYPLWNSYRKAICDCHSALSAIINGKRCRISLHYSNMIASDGQNSYSTDDIADLFNIKPTLEGQLPGEFSDFIVGCEFANSDDNTASRMTLTTITEKTENKKNYMLYICFNSKDLMEQSEVPEWIERSHDGISRLFEGAITERLREKFKPVKTDASRS